jgi:hypothetical protein
MRKRFAGLIQTYDCVFRSIRRTSLATYYPKHTPCFLPLALLRIYVPRTPPVFADWESLPAICAACAPDSYRSPVPHSRESLFASWAASAARPRPILTAWRHRAQARRPEADRDCPPAGPAMTLSCLLSCLAPTICCAFASTTPPARANRAGGLCSHVQLRMTTPSVGPELVLAAIEQAPRRVHKRG